MPAHVRYRRGKWCVDYFDTKKKRHVIQVGARDEGKDKAERKLAEIIRDGKRAPNEYTFQPYGEWWLENCAKDEIKESTYEEYKAVLENHLYPVFGSKLLDRIERAEVRQFVTQKRASGLSRSTIRNILAPMRAMFNQMIEDGELRFNPAANVGKINKKRKHETRRGEAGETKKLNTFSKEDVTTLLKKALEHLPHYHPTLLCAFRTGLRMGELIALKPMDLDFNSRFLEVRRTFYRGRITPPKSNESRRVDMSQQLTHVLQELISKRRAVALRKEMEKPADERRDAATVVNEVIEGWLFTTAEIIPKSKGRSPAAKPRGGTQLDPSNLRKVFFSLLTKAGLRRIRFHDIRHTYASLLIQQGESLPYVRDQLGHSSIQITVDTYGHLAPGGNRQAVDRLDDSTPVKENGEKSEQVA